MFFFLCSPLTASLFPSQSGQGHSLLLARSTDLYPRISFRHRFFPLRAGLAELSVAPLALFLQNTSVLVNPFDGDMLLPPVPDRRWFHFPKITRPPSPFPFIDTMPWCPLVRLSGRSRPSHFLGPASTLPFLFFNSSTSLPLFFVKPARLFYKLSSGPCMLPFSGIGSRRNPSLLCRAAFLF